ncbi:MAG: recombinase family protein [Halobacteriota archaeon]
MKRLLACDSAASIAVIEQAQAWRASGLSYREIAAMLNAAGMPTKQGGQWWDPTVRGILTKP